MGNLEKVITCLRELGIRPKLNDFQSKLIVQKSVYLLTAMGIKTDYHFNFYVRGTYSPELTNDMYRNKDAIQALSGGAHLSEKERKLLEEFKAEMQPFDPAVLEIAATYAYFFKQSDDARFATIETKKAKPFFSELQFVRGINSAKGLVYQPTEEDLRKLREEMRAWDAASDEDGKKWV